MISGGLLVNERGFGFHQVYDVSGRGGSEGGGGGGQDRTGQDLNKALAYGI